MFIRTPALAPAFLAVFLPLALAGCGHGSQDIRPAKPVVALKLSPTDTTARNEYSGDVHARYESALGFRVPGKILSRNVNLGDSVKAGQLLARLDAADAALNKDAAQANYNHAQRAFELRGNQLAYTELRADHDGVVTAVDAEAGQVVQEGQTVMSLAWSSGREVYIDVPENHIADFNTAKDIGVTLWGAQGKHYTGTVREKSASADPATRTFLVKIAIRDPGPEVKLGMTAAVAVADAIDPEELLLPLSALYHKDTETAAWVVDPKTSQLKLKPVQVLRYTEAGAVIGSGLAPGDTVVLKGVNELYESEPVATSAAAADEKGDL
jgi:membrane fusion protein, multidrug efflux system